MTLLDQAISSTDETATRYMRVLLWGQAGLGKTVTALELARHFNLKMFGIDADGGLSAYARDDYFNPFHYDTTEDPIRVLDLLEELLRDPRDYNLVLLDPVSTVWRHTQLQTEDYRRNIVDSRTGRRSSVFQNMLTMGDWGPIKRIAFRLGSSLHRLGVPVIATAREKNKWKNEAIAGVEPDAEAAIAHEFDVVIHLTRMSESAPRIAYVNKDRWHRLPATLTANDAEDPFWVARALIEAYGDRWTASTEARPRPSEDQLSRLYGLTQTMGLRPEQVSRALEKYRVSSYDELNPEDADGIIDKMEAAIAARNNDQEA